MKSGTAIVQLAHYGDIINILPLVKIIADQDGRPPTLIVPESHGSLLDGISYATFGTVNTNKLTFQTLMEALERRYDRVIVPQVSMKGLSYERRCSSFTMEAWNRAGMLPYWHTKEAPLFDRRNEKREEALVNRWIKKGMVNILVNLSGISSPFQHAELVWQDLNYRWGNHCNLINMGGIRAEKFFDLLGLMECAFGLITTDTGTLHLAASMANPVFAFIADNPSLWHGSIPGGNVPHQVRYKEAIVRLEELHWWVNNIVNRPVTKAHVYCEYPSKGDSEKRRRAIARTSWTIGESLYPRPVYDEQMPRLFHDGKRSIPYVKDMINLVFSDLHMVGGILLTNSDSCFAPEMKHFRPIGESPMWFRRRDFKKIDEVLTQAEVNKGEDYCGTDMFWIPHQWWDENKTKFPDLLMGTEGWDCCLRELMRQTGGLEIPNCCYHERHDSVWERAENRYTLSSQKHNIALSKEFLKKLGLRPEKYGFI